MVDQIFAWLSGGNSSYIYWGVLSSLVLSAFGLPIPEDIPLIFSGIALAKESVEFYYMLPICFIGVLVGDQIVFWLGYKFGSRLLVAGKKLPFLPVITNESLAKVHKRWKKHRYLLLLAARHFFPIRTASILAVGALRVSWLDFLVADCLAVTVSTSLMVSLGYFLGLKLSPEVITHIAERLNLYLGLALIILGIGWFFHVKQKAESLATKLLDTPEEE